MLIVNDAVHDASPPSKVFSIPGVSVTIYFSCGVLAGYECLLFFLAIRQAGIRRSKGKPAVQCWTGRHLADIIIKGNVMYFFMWVFIYHYTPHLFMDSCRNTLSVFVYLLALKSTLLHVSSV